MFGVILATVLFAVPADLKGKPYPVLPLPAQFYTVDNLLDAMYTVESKRGKELVGDGGRAIGPYQIWREYWQDAVEWDKTIGGSYKDCMDKAYSEKIVRAYWARYAPKGATVEQLARIHNGGPKGHTRNATLKYWQKIVKAMRG
jgi:hypothetical protein